MFTKLLPVVLQHRHENADTNHVQEHRQLYRRDRAAPRRVQLQARVQLPPVSVGQHERHCERPVVAEDEELDGQRVAKEAK